MPYRRYPAHPEPAPRTLAGRQVIEFVRVPAREGELPNLGLAIGRESDRPEDRAYAVWDVSFSGGEWVPYGGHYDLSRADAEKELARRIKGAGI